MAAAAIFPIRQSHALLMALVSGLTFLLARTVPFIFVHGTEHTHCNVIRLHVFL
jgi:hypothetical protein